MSEAARGIPSPNEEGVEEDFLYHLYRGGELLAAGKNLEARDELERAYHLKPQNPKAQNLLGLVYFKLGLLDRAIEIYDRLVRDNAADATLRINLGLVYLKSGQVHEAIAQLEAAVGAIPDHPKALNYLGLAYAQAQAHHKAREIFDRAGNLAMVRKMEEALRGDSGAAESQGFEQPAPPRAHHLMEGADLMSQAEPAAAPPRLAGGPAPSLMELARQSVYAPGAAEPFLMDGSEVTIRISGEVRSRLTGLLWARGKVERQGEQKRFRGRPTDKPFGEGADRVYRLTGEGQMVFSAEGLTFTPVGLEDEAAYLVEEALFAFEESLGYENGRVPSKIPPDLQLVHLRGHGKALLRSQGAVRSVEVKSKEPLQLPIDRLLGWLGPLTPTLLLPDEGGDPTDAQSAGRWLRLEGDGWALWAMPPKKG